MKILVPSNSQESVPSPPPITAVNQQEFLQSAGGGNGSSASKDFTSNHGSLAQKANRRDQHQKHTGGPNKAKFTHGNNGGRPMQLSQHQQHKFHHNSNSGSNKGKKQHYASNSNTTSSLNRKKFHQHQQNTLQQINYHNHHSQNTSQHQQNQYMSAMHSNQHKFQTTMNATATQTTATTSSSNSSTSSNNNNCHLVKNQNYSNIVLSPKTNLCVDNNSSSTTPSANSSNCTTTQSDISISSITSSESSCKCSNQSHNCDKSSSFVEKTLQKYPQDLLCAISNDTTQIAIAASTSSSPSFATHPTNITSIPKTEALANCKCFPKFAKITQSTASTLVNIKLNKKNKIDTAPKQQYFLESESLSQCQCGLSSFAAAGHSLHTTTVSYQPATATNNKKKNWKIPNNNNCCGSRDVIDGGVCDICSVSLKPSNVQVTLTENYEGKICNNLSSSCNSSGDVCNNSQRKQKDPLQSAGMSTGFNLQKAAVPSVEANASNSVTEKSSFLSSSPTSIHKLSKANQKSIDVTKPNKNETSKGISAADNDINILESNNSRSVDTNAKTRNYSCNNVSSPSSYSLDFLHSVGVQMSGATKSSASNSSTEDNLRPLSSAKSANGTQGRESSAACSGYPCSSATSNQRQHHQQQQRYVNEGGISAGGGNNHNTYHHPQPTQLTIASFLKKDILGESIQTSSNSGSSTACNSTRASNSSNLNNSTYNEQHYVRSHQYGGRYYNNYYPTYYHQHHTSQHTMPHISACGYNGDVARFTSNGGNQRSFYGGYLNYQNNNSPNTNGSLQYTNQTPPTQESSRTHFSHSIESHGVAVGDSTTTNKKGSVGSSRSSCSSLSSTSSTSSCGSNRKLQQQQNASVHNQQKSLTQHLAIETLPSKLNSQQGSSQRQGLHRGHNQHGQHHGHGGHHYYSHHHHHQHVVAHSTPTTPQHQNYYNLTYVCTDGNNGTSSRSCSPAPVLPPTPASSNPSPRSLDNCSVPGPSPAALAANLQLNTAPLNYTQYSQNSTSQQYHHYQQNHLFNKKLLAPLSLNVPSPSPSPTPTHLGGASLQSHIPALVPQNIICCAQLDEASTAAAAAAANNGIIAGNDYDSDASSTHSSAQNRKYSSCRSALSSASSVASLCGGSKPHQLECKSQPGTPIDASASTTPLGSPIGYNTYAASLVHVFPKLQVSSTTGTTQQPHYNQSQNDPKASSNSAQLPLIYHNGGVTSMLNLPGQTTNIGEAATPNNYSDDDCHRQQTHFLLPLTSTQSSAEHLNMPSFSAGTSRSNSSSGYWSPSQQCSFYNQLPLTGLMTTNLIVPNAASCGSSSSSISPSLPDRDDSKQSIQHTQNKLPPSSGNTSPTASSSCSNEQLGISEALLSSTNSSSTLSGRAGAIVRTCERNSSQLLGQQQQRLIVQQTQHPPSPTLPLSNNTSFSTAAQRARNCGSGGRNHQYTQNNPTLISSVTANCGAMTNNNQQTTAMIPQIFSHHQLQSMPPPPPPHNLLYNNPQTTNPLRPLGNSSVHDFFTHTPPDRFLARAHLIEAKEAPASLLNNSKWDNLSRDIWTKFISSQQTEETFKQKMKLWRYLYLFIKNAYPRYGLYLVGSTISGFGSDTSDVDMCLVSRSASNIDPRMEALFNLTVLKDCLSKSGEFEYFNLIEAKVPILRFRDRVHQLEVDLNFNNCVGIKNTHLLYCYSQLDWRLRPLVLVTKLWAQHHNINNAKNMTISSYSLVLMVIHFLQYAVQPPVLPCLHQMFPHKFPLLRSNDFGFVDMNETIGPYESKNSQTIGELFLNFLEYYSNFDYSQHAISVRTGGILPINACRTAKSLKNDIHQWKELCIEEPFDLTNTARSVYDFETFERVKGVFVSSWRVLKDTLDLNSIFLPDIEQTVQQVLSNFNAESEPNGIDDTIHLSTDSITLSWTEDCGTLESSSDDRISSTSKQTTKYGGLKRAAHVKTNEDMLLELNANVNESVCKPSPLILNTVSSTPTTLSHSLTKSFNGKFLNRSHKTNAAMS
ncbi:poly(A) RNA polymerase gld-2 homolog B [Stomoxys calcitrans]|uniref:poly(A) RNA polymerase gld-2 homolog B n=1 Tax=Stomoxys calcitrans TaxID=35570 RepID=UPI0027E2B191|nr:poly(A) RNA polymerase gld-2 homolog B [Stomoxys calcitrans]